MTCRAEILDIVMLLLIIHHTSLTWRDLGVIAVSPLEAIKPGLIAVLCAVASLFMLRMGARLIDPNCFEPDAPFLTSADSHHREPLPA